MKNWFFCLIVALLLNSNSIFAQRADFNLLNATRPEMIGDIPESRMTANKDKPLDYGYVDDRDILWSKVVWEKVDLKEKFNLPLYYPIDSLNVESSRKSLFYTLLKGIRNGDIKHVYEDSFFKIKLGIKDIEERLVKLDTLDTGFDMLNAGESDISEYVDRYEIKSEAINAYMIKGIWYIDKKESQMKYRVLAIAPMAPDVQTMGSKGTSSEEEESIPLFWIFYPGAREVLFKGTAFNLINPRTPISFDNLFNARRFHSVIVREENEYGNRAISEYVKDNSLFQVLESDRIKEEIRNKELDMWNY